MDSNFSDNAAIECELEINVDKNIVTDGNSNFIIVCHWVLENLDIVLYLACMGYVIVLFDSPFLG